MTEGPRSLAELVWFKILKSFKPRLLTVMSRVTTEAGESRYSEFSDINFW